ncbi:PEP-CTERM sorting domain-containing protein [Paludisphaera rhizosphaerae]|uniref:PEP-CTERM sorting domain-containing protein n=1 Tax=Paludisphaera rhizosphaerae TaxID=2711216 RepID=UPI0013EABC4D|nr:PEP-CTERM sorting domain-containing protein [Paludisphaera rhizosphaerae]
MIKLSARFLAASAFALALGLTHAPATVAGPIFDYVSTVNVATAPTLPGNPPGFGAAVISIGAGNSLTFTTNTGTSINGGLPGGADINYGNIIFNASGSDTVVSYAVNFNYQLTITDRPSGLTGTINFTGQVTGSAQGSPRGINSMIVNYDVAPKTLTLAGYTYTLSIKPSTGPGSLFDGVLQGNVQVTAVVPEPSSIALLGLGSLGGLAAVLRRRRSQA